MIIVVSGLDGSGKTGLVHEIAAAIGDTADTFHLPHNKHLRDILELFNDRDITEDMWTDRLAYALDNRLADRKFRQAEAEGKHIVSQRGWMDSLIHGAASGYTYKEMLNLIKVEDLVSPAASVYLICEPETAWQRIKDDEYKDRWETPAYLKKQHQATLDFYHRAGSGELADFNEPKMLLDTTNLTPVEVQQQVVVWLRNIKVL